MELATVLGALLLGIVEGLTEFIPVSSTGHLILLVDLLGFQGPPGRVFEIVIQLGAILAICVVYHQRFRSLTVGIARDPEAQRFAVLLALGVLPALVIGFFAHGFIKSVLFSPWVVSVALIVGGLLIFLIERIKPEPEVETVDAMSFPLALKIGLCQCLAMIPGVSRSGASILGAVMLGVERRAATEFSFFLAVPTMLAATVYDLYKNWADLDWSAGGVIAIGFVSAFLAALVVVRYAVAFIGRHGFAPFAWYRIAIGSVMLVVLIAGT